MKGVSYGKNAQVKYMEMKWVSTEDNTNPDCPPGPICNNDINWSENSPWVILYPWSHFSSDNLYVEIEPWTWFSDGDNWTADIGKIGRKQEITNDMLSEVTVVPNPYRASSDYSNAGIYFNHLPTECEINIFTISGDAATKPKSLSRLVSMLLYYLLSIETLTMSYGLLAVYYPMVLF